MLAGGGTEERPVLLLLDELQNLYAKDRSQVEALYGYIKRLKQGQQGLRLFILAAAVFGNAPSAAAGDATSTSVTPFDYSPDQLVGFHPSDEQGSPALALTPAEHEDLWTKFWSSHPRGNLFHGDATRDALLALTAGQVCDLQALTGDACWSECPMS